MKNKHNTMNSSSSAKTYMKMQNQLLINNDCACFLVEIIAKKSQNTLWKTSVDGQKLSHPKIRRVSIDQFYHIVTGQDDAFYQICMLLSKTIQEILVEENQNLVIPSDTVYDELNLAISNFDLSQTDMMINAICYLAFNSYNGFSHESNVRYFNSFLNKHK